MILCSQNTPRLSATVAHLGLQSQRVRQDRPVSISVVVNFGGQPFQPGLFVPEVRRTRTDSNPGRERAGGD